MWKVVQALEEAFCWLANKMASWWQYLVVVPFSRQVSIKNFQYAVEVSVRIPWILYTISWIKKLIDISDVVLKVY